MSRADLFGRAQALLPRLSAWRRHLHAAPELSYHEEATRDYVGAELRALGFDTRPVAGTGLVARMKGETSPRPVVALRAELDALPIREANDVEYRSKNEGVMHACGHDAHMTMVLGAALLLKECAPEMLASTVLIFQPAEEVPPGGARRLLEDGVLEEEQVSAIFALHVDPRYPAGRLLLKRGPLMAASDRFTLDVIGKGGHGGYPHLTVDPIVVAAQIVLGVQTIVSRRLEPTEPGVISIGTIAGGTADNVIPDRVSITGTLRSHSPEVRKALPDWIRQAAEGIAAGCGARVEFAYLPGHPGLSNDPGVIDGIRSILEPALGPDNVMDLPRPIMGGEDFSHYLERYPGAFLRLGVRNEAEGIVHPIHSARFDIDERALATGAAALAAIARDWTATDASAG